MPKTTIVLAGALFSVLFGVVAVSAQSDNKPREIPGAGTMALAFTTVRGWLDEFSMPDPGDAASHIALPDARAICIVIRRTGKVVGVGTDWTGDDLMLRRAAARAFGEALTDPVVRNLVDTVPDEVGRGLMLDVEIAGAPIPLVAATTEQLAAEVRPGLDGVALRRGNDWHFRFPVESRLTGTADALALIFPGLLVDFGLNGEKPLATLQRETGLSVYRFRTAQFIEPVVGSAPIETFRGDVLVSLQSIDHKAIALTAEGILDFLDASLWPSEHALGLRGEYRATTDQYRAKIASAGEQAMIAWSLSRFARSPGVPAVARERALVLAQRIVNDLATLEEAEDSPVSDPIACAFLVMAGASLVQQAPLPDATKLLSSAESVLVKSFDTEGGFRVVSQGAPDVNAPRFSPTSQAILAFALAERFRAGARTIPAETIRQAIDTAWQSVAAPNHLTLMPWIGWAEAAYADATGEPSLAHLDDLKRIRELLRTVQVSPAGHPDVPDLHGGFELAGRFGPRTTSQGLRGAAWLATIADDQRIVPDYLQRAEVERLRSFARFLRQLSVRPESAWSYPAPARAMGGIRNAAWDAEEALPAQALGLLTCGELLRLLPP